MGSKSNLPVNFVSDPEQIRRQENKRRKAAAAALKEKEASLPPPVPEPVPVKEMAMWEFPPLKKIETIRTFNGDGDELDDFTTSVDAFIYARDYPLKQGGWVRQEADGDWEYCCEPPENEAAAIANRVQLNYKYSKKFIILLAERFTGAAREWWITAGKNTNANCWRPATAGRCPPNITEIPFINLLRQQFLNSRSHETAQTALERLKWDTSEESPAAFRSRVGALFNKAGIHEFAARRPIVLKVLSKEMKRQVMRPNTEAELWLKIEEALATEESIEQEEEEEQERRKGRSSKGDKNKKDMKDLTCYTCQKKGHISPNCPENKDKGKERERDKGRRDTRRSDEDVCYNCGGKGHRSPDCPSRSFGKRREKPASDKRTANLQMDTRESSPQFFYQAAASVSRNTKPQSDDLGSYFYQMKPDEAFTDFYAFDTLPWYDETQDEHWHQEETELHLLTQNHYDECKYGVPSAQLTTTEFYAQEQESPQTISLDEPNLPDSTISFEDMFDVMSKVMSSPVVPCPRGSMRTYTYTLDDRKMLTVGDTGTAVNVVPKSVLQGTGLAITRPPDQRFVTTDGITISPLGICDEFRFRFGGIQYTVKAYVCERAGFQLLLGTQFWWAVGGALFPRLGKIIVTRPALRVIAATCDLIAPEQRPPPLSMQAPGKPPTATPVESATIDPATGEELLEHPPPEFHYMDVRPIGEDRFASLLKISTYSDVITVGEKDYINDIDEDGEDTDLKEPDPIPPDIITDAFIQERLDINPAAPNWFKERIIAIAMKYHKAISWTENDLGLVKDVPYEIVLKEGTVPVRQASRRHLYLPKNQEIIKKKSELLIRMGIWRPCKFSPWLTQLVIAKKGCVCHDFTSLNAATVLDAFPIHSMPDIVSSQAGMGIWSLMDTDRGYLQIIMALLCIFLTAFKMFYRMWESWRMLFGMTGAPATFHRNMTVMMEPVIEKFQEYVNWFFDDIIVGTKKDDWGIHADVIDCIMKAAEDRGWKFGVHKMHFGYNKMRLLGIIMTPHGRSPDPDKRDTLLEMHIPRTASELKSFVGLAQWFSEHIPGLSWKTSILRKMITTASSPNALLKWTESGLQQFQYIKDQMRKPCTLAVYNPKANVILYTDACAEGLGCILVQIQNDGQEVIIAFGSSSLSKAQQRYHITRLEALAFIWTLGHFHLYLSAKPFLWRTDHRALKFIFDASKTAIPAL